MTSKTIGSILASFSSFTLREKKGVCVMIEKAIQFAAEAHKGQTRKGVPVPYILHPMEVAAIVSGMTTDEEIIVAAILHDTLEDCKEVTTEELEENFGAKVLDLVKVESEDKSKTWIERKEATITHLKVETRIEVKMIALADKLANLRSMVRAYDMMGEEIFLYFNQKDPSKIAWYYRSIRDTLYELKDTAAYREYCRLIEELFTGK